MATPSTASSPSNKSIVWFKYTNYHHKLVFRRGEFLLIPPKERAEGQNKTRQCQCSSCSHSGLEGTCLKNMPRKSMGSSVSRAVPDSGQLSMSLSSSFLVALAELVWSHTELVGECRSGVSEVPSLFHFQ